MQLAPVPQRLWFVITLYDRPHPSGIGKFCCRFISHSKHNFATNRMSLHEIVYR